MSITIYGSEAKLYVDGLPATLSADYLDSLRYLMGTIYPGIYLPEIDDEEDDEEFRLECGGSKYILSKGIDFTPVSIDFAFPSCSHKPKLYYGLFETYKFCETCNEKLPE